MLDEMRLHGESAEVRNEVVRLAKKFGILTPYTSYLVVEDERRVARRPGGRWGGGHAGAPAPDEPATAGLRRRLKGAAEELERAAGEKNDSGAGAVRKSKEADAMKKAPAKPESAAPTAEGGGRGWGGYAGKKEDKEQLAQTQKDLESIMKKVGAKTFYLSSGTWYDSTYKKDMKEVKVKYMSDEYFDLLAKHPGAAKYFAVASKVVVVIGGTAYRIVEE
jgi:Ca-activated chloride channel family protein